MIQGPMQNDRTFEACKFVQRDLTRTGRQTNEQRHLDHFCSGCRVSYRGYVGESA